MGLKLRKTHPNPPLAGEGKKRQTQLLAGVFKHFCLKTLVDKWVSDFH